MKTTLRNKPETVQVGNIVVKIYSREKTGGYKVFEVADYSKGFRQLRSFSDHAEARTEAEKIARQLSTGEVTAAQMNGKDAAEYGQAKEIIRPTGLSLIV